MGKLVVGLDGKLYYGTAGSQAGTELTNAQDVNVIGEKGEADVTRRGSGGWNSVRGTTKDLRIEFTLVDEIGDAAKAALKAAFLNNTLIALFAKDDTTGDGPDADFEVLNFSRNEPLKEGITYSVTCKASDENRTPTWS